MGNITQLEKVFNDAKDDDVATIDSILCAFYEVISGPAGQPRQWARDATLYAPGAVLVRTGKKDSKTHVTVMDIPGYIQSSDPLLQQGFYEQEVHRVTRTFGNVAHVFSTYEARHTPDGPVFMRGINLIHLVNDGRRWWIISAVWDTEREDNPIPPEFTK